MASSPTSRPGSGWGLAGCRSLFPSRSCRAGGREASGGPGLAAGSGLPALSKGSLAGALRALGHSGLHTPASLRGHGPGGQPGPPRGPWCPGGRAFRRQTLHRGPTAAAPPSPPPRPCCGHLSEGAAPASPTPRRSDSGWSHLSAPPHGSLTPKVLPQGWLRAGRSCYAPSFPATPSPVLVTPGPGFPACELGSSTQPQQAPVPEDREEEGPCGPVLGRSSPPSCPAAPQDGPRPREGSEEPGSGSWANSTPLCAQSWFLQLPLRSGQRGPAWPGMS
ncbi:unnamed protein product [Rangifer tarandus platyrhynchus]|uniref:Uncharacterized protein n=1 Tax=Rangifer tarandus platyrhynchus TaxID=3082113 RepID=A0AC59Z769_RANTA